MKRVKNLEWKESLFKSIVYRIITVIIGFITALIVTGRIDVAISVASLTEFVQFINYFVFEMLWTNLRTRKRLEEEIRKRIVDLEINYDSVLELAYKMSRIDTFIQEVYESALNFFTSILENEELKDLHEQISKYLEYFKHTHSNRGFTTYKTI